MQTRLARKGGTYNVRRTKPYINIYPRHYPRVKRAPNSVSGFRLSGGNTKRWARWVNGAEEIFRIGKGGFPSTIRNRRTGEVWLYKPQAQNQKGPKLGVAEPERQHLYTQDLKRVIPRTKQKEFAERVKKLKEKERVG